MKRILILIIGLFGVAYGQFSPTSAKTKFVNGLSIGSKDSTYFTNAGDTVVLYIGRDSAVYTRFKGYHRKLSFVGDTTAMLLPYLRNSDTAAMLSDYVDLGSTQTIAGLKTFTSTVNSGGSNFVTGGAVWANGNLETISGSIGFGNSTRLRLGQLDAIAGFAGGNNIYFNSGTPNIPRAASNGTVAGYYYSGGGSVNLYANTILYGESVLSPRVRIDSSDGAFRVFSTTASSSTTTGALIVSGGAGIAGQLTANTIVKSGGTSSQFLKADGSVDGTSYATAASLSGYVDLTTNQTVGGAKTFSSVLTASVGLSSLYGYFTNGGAATPTAANSGQYFSASTGVNNYAGTYYDGSTAYSSFFGRVPSALSGVNDGLGYVTIEGTPTLRMLFSKSAITTYVPLNGTSLSMSGGGSFGAPSTISVSSNSGSGNSFPRLNIENTLATQGDGSSTFNFADIRLASGNSSVQMFVGTSFAAGVWGPQGRIAVSSNHPLVFSTNNTERSRIASDGTFLINTTTTESPYKLIVNGGVKGTTGDFTTSLISGAITNIANGSGVYSALGATNTSSTASIFIGVGGSAVANTPLRNNAYVMNTANSSLILGTNDQARVTIDNTGAATFSSSVTASGYRFAYAAKSSNYTLTDNDDYINVTSSCTITLPTAVGRSGKRYVIKCVGSVTATVASTSSQTIDGNAASTYTFGGPNFNIMIVYSDGANWRLEAWQTGI